MVMRPVRPTRSPWWLPRLGHAMCTMGPWPHRPHMRAAYRRNAAMRQGAMGGLSFAIVVATPIWGQQACAPPPPSSQRAD